MHLLLFISKQQTFGFHKEYTCMCSHPDKLLLSYITMLTKGYILLYNQVKLIHTLSLKFFKTACWRAVISHYSLPFIKHKYFKIWINCVTLPRINRKSHKEDDLQLRSES